VLAEGLNRSRGRVASLLGLGVAEVFGFVSYVARWGDPPRFTTGTTAMNESTEGTSVLRQRMIEDMRMRKLSVKTQAT
jgi:hypothetical protein